MAATDFNNWLSQILGLGSTGEIDPMRRLPDNLKFADFSEALNYQISSNAAMSEDAWNTFKTQYWPAQEELLKTMGGQPGQPGVPDTLTNYFAQALKPQDAKREMGISESDTKQAYKGAYEKGKKQLTSMGITPQDSGFMGLISDAGVEQARDVSGGRTATKKIVDSERLNSLQSAVTTGYQGLQTITNPTQAATTFGNIATGGAAGGSSAQSQLSIAKSQQKAADQAGLESLITQAAMMAVFAS